MMHVDAYAVTISIPMNRSSLDFTVVLDDVVENIEQLVQLFKMVYEAGKSDGIILTSDSIRKVFEEGENK